MNVRPARVEEANRVLEMYEWLFAPPGYTPPTWDLDRALEALRRAIEGERSTILVAENKDGALVGVISAYLDLHSVRYGLRCWVEDLAVDPEHRSGGGGKVLLDAAKAWARAQGATHLELDTGLAREGAQRFYDREAPSATGYSYSWML